VRNIMEPPSPLRNEVVAQKLPCFPEGKTRQPLTRAARLRGCLVERGECPRSVPSETLPEKGA